MHGGDIPIHHLVGALKDVANANCPESKASLLYNDAKMGGGYSPILCAMHLAGSLVPEVHDITTGGSFWNSFAKGFKKGFVGSSNRTWADPSSRLGGRTQHAQSIEPNQPKELEGTLLLLGH